MAEDTTSHPRNPPRPVTLAKGPQRSVTLAKGPQRPVTISKAPLGKITLSTRPQIPVTLAKNLPGEVSKAKGPERPVTLPKGPPREVSTVKPERPVTLAKAPERSVTLPSKPQREVTLAKGPEREVTLAKQPSREITLAKGPIRPVTLAKGPERPVTLAKGPERPVTLAKGPERPVTLAKRPPRPETLPTQPERPVTLARRDQMIQPATPPRAQPPPAQPRRVITQRLSPQKPTPGKKVVTPKANLRSTLPTPNAFCQIEGYQPFPAKWERWLSAVREGVLSAQPVAGRHVTLDIHEGMGTVVNVADNRRKTPSGACIECPPDTVTVNLIGVSLCTGCIVLGGISEGLSAILSGGSVDGTYELTAISTEGLCCYEGNFETAITSDTYFGAECSDFFTTEGLSLSIWAGRTSDPDCKWSVFAWLGASAVFDELAVFLGLPQTSFATAFNNALTCAGGHDTFLHPCSVREWEGVGADSGTATLTE